MGIAVLFYNWLGFTYFVSVFYIIIYPDLFVPMWVYYLYYILNYGSAIFLIIVGIQFFRNKLVTWQKNALVLLFGIFLGSILGTSMETLSTFLLLIFLSIWDIIAVFKGPLGKIANIIMDNRKKVQDRVENAQNAQNMTPTNLASTEIPATLIPGTTTGVQIPPQSSYDEEPDLDVVDAEYIKTHKSELEIELGSGDLIFYSAFVAHVIVRTGSLFLGLMVTFGVVLGAYLTIRQLFINKKVLPALPFSIFIGVGMFLLGKLIQFLLALMLAA